MWKSKEDKRAYERRYYHNNKEKLAKTRLRWMQKHPKRAHDIALRAYRNYRSSPKGAYSSIKQNAKKRGIDFKIKQDEFLDWYKKQEKACSYCGIPQNRLAGKFTPRARKTYNKNEGHYDGKKGKYNYSSTPRLSIDRLDNSGSYTLDNITLACHLCNSIKFDILSADEMREIGQRYIRPRWEK